MSLFKKAEKLTNVTDEVKEEAKQALSDLDLEVVTGGTGEDDAPIELPFIPV